MNKNNSSQNNESPYNIADIRRMVVYMRKHLKEVRHLLYAEGNIDIAFLEESTAIPCQFIADFVLFSRGILISIGGGSDDNDYTKYSNFTFAGIEHILNPTYLGGKIPYQQRIARLESILGMIANFFLPYIDILLGLAEGKSGSHTLQTEIQRLVNTAITIRGKPTQVHEFLRNIPQ